MEKKQPLHSLLAGLILGLVLVGLSLLPAGSTPGWLGGVLVILCVGAFVHLFGRKNNYQLSFGELFGYGFRIAIAVALVYVIYIGITAVVSPELKAQAIAAAKAEYEKQKGVTPSDVENFVNTMNKNFWIQMVGGSMFVLMVMGAIGSLLGAAVTKRVPKSSITPTDQLDQLKS